MSKQIIFPNSSESRLSGGSYFVEIGGVLESQLKVGTGRRNRQTDKGYRGQNWDPYYAVPY